MRVDALVFKLWRSGSFDFKTMAAKLYRRQLNQHSVTSDGLRFHYLDERRALAEMVADVHRTIAPTAQAYDILLVVYRQCDFTVVTRGYRAPVISNNSPEYRSNGQIIWKGTFGRSPPVRFFVDTASDDNDRVQPPITTGSYCNLDSPDDIVNGPGIIWGERFVQSAHWAILLPAPVSFRPISSRG